MSSKQDINCKCEDVFCSDVLWLEVVAAVSLRSLCSNKCALAGNVSHHVISSHL